MIYIYIYTSHTDLNDCSINNGNCQQICRNLPGGKQCDCVPGSQLNPDKLTCSGMYNNRNTSKNTPNTYTNQLLFFRPAWSFRPQLWTELDILVFLILVFLVPFWPLRGAFLSILGRVTPGVINTPRHNHMLKNKLYFWGSIFPHYALVTCLSFISIIILRCRWDRGFED